MDTEKIMALSELDRTQYRYKAVEQAVTTLIQERDSYQQAADQMAASHKVERDALFGINDTLRADYEKLKAELVSLKLNGPQVVRGTDGAGNEKMGTMRQVMCDFEQAADAEAKEVDRLQTKLADLKDLELVAKVIRNTSGQISLVNADGDYFDVSKYVGKSFFAKT